MQLDAILSRRLFIELEKLPDLTQRLTEEEAFIGKKVDLVPRSGNVACMATRAAIAEIVDLQVCPSPEGISPAVV